MCSVPGIEKEGEWPATKIWVTKKRMRMTDHETFIEAGVEAGSKAMKQLTKED